MRRCFLAVVLLGILFAAEAKRLHKSNFLKLPEQEDANLYDELVLEAESSEETNEVRSDYRERSEFPISETELPSSQCLFGCQRVH